MAKADTGQTVRVHYRGTLKDGTEFDSSHKRSEPMEFTLGLDPMIPGFERAVTGLEPGQSTQVDIPADEAYGLRNDELVRDFPLNEFPDDLELEEGLLLSADGPDGQRVRFKVISIGEQAATLDGNHPLAGQDLRFEIELLEIL